MKIIEHLQQAIRSAGVFNKQFEVAPACILWTDGDRQWEQAIPILQAQMPELAVLGDYAPEKRTGPAIWLRCLIAGHTTDVTLPGEWPPILYLPGVSRQDLRNIENCPDHLKPLVELQFRGALWSQLNGKDWTILAYLKTDQGGLGLDVAQDNGTKNAMELALCKLLDEEIPLLKGKHLDKDYFNTLLTGGDLSRDFLQWLNEEEEFRAGRDENQWRAFVEICKSQLRFNPQTDGVLEGATRLANHEGPWAGIWERYCEAPGRYPHIPAQIRKCYPPGEPLLWHMGGGAFDGWPQWNDDQERILRGALTELADVPAHVGRAKLLELEKQHGRRRSLVWAELGEAPLACALEHLATMAKSTQESLAAGTIDDLTTGYTQQGWQADDGVIKALALASDNSPANLNRIQAPIRSVYLPWMEASARHLQKLVDDTPYPGGTHLNAKTTRFNPGDCVMFVDGLRFDTGKQLAKSLKAANLEVEEEPVWAALPSVTATGKAAVTPVRDKIKGDTDSTDFVPSVAATGQPLNSYHLKSLLTQAGWLILERGTTGEADNGDGGGVDKEASMAWCEFGDLDRVGHDRGWKLASQIDTLVKEITARIGELLAAGWKRVRVVTDHGWLLMPGGLPKVELPRALTDTKWRRCASLKPGASTKERLYPWYWNPNQHFALADGISCFRKGVEYTHGGLSLQECLTLQLTVTRGEQAGEPMGTVKFTDVVWRGMRCTVAVEIEGDFSGDLFLDIRLQAGNPLSSVALSSKPFKADKPASVVVEDEDLEGKEATLVIIDANGTLIGQNTTIIGGSDD